MPAASSCAALAQRLRACPKCVQGGSDAQDVAAVQMRVLKKRRGRLLNRRTILKSYLFHEDEGRGPPEVRARAAACGNVQGAQRGVSMESSGHVLTK